MFTKSNQKNREISVECNTNEFKENDYIKFYNFEDKHLKIIVLQRTI